MCSTSHKCHNDRSYALEQWIMGCGWRGRGFSGDCDGPTAALAQGVVVVWGSSLVCGMGGPVVVL